MKKKPSPSSHRRTETAAAHRRAVTRVIQALRRDPAADLSLDDMARLAFTSRFHFNRIFRRLTGIPPGLFHSALRLQEAKRLLLTTDLTVLDVCFEVGYQSPGTFVRRFTERVGLSPQQVRALGRRGEPLQELPGRLPEAPRDGAIDGTAAAPPGWRIDGAIFAGLFPRSIVEGRPAGWVLLSGPGRFRLPAVPDGDYHLCAATVPLGGDPARHLLGEEEGGLRSETQKVRVRGGEAEGPLALTLRPAETFDPPVLLASPLLLAGDAAL